MIFQYHQRTKFIFHKWYAILEHVILWTEISADTQASNMLLSSSHSNWPLRKIHISNGNTYIYFFSLSVTQLLPKLPIYKYEFPDKCLIRSMQGLSTIWRAPAFIPVILLFSPSCSSVQFLLCFRFACLCFVSCVQCSLCLLNSSCLLSPMLRLYVLSSLLWCPLRFQYKQRCSVRIYHQLFVGGIMSWLCYLCLYAHSGVKFVSTV